MKVKRFFAPDMSSAMRLVRDEVGPDAVILSNNSVAGGVEVVVALDYSEVTRPRPSDLVVESRKERQVGVLTGQRKNSRLQSELGRTRSALASSREKRSLNESPFLTADKDRQLGLGDDSWDDEVWDDVLASLNRPKSTVSKERAVKPPARSGAASARSFPRAHKTEKRELGSVAQVSSRAVPKAAVHKAAPAVSPALKNDTAQNELGQQPSVQKEAVSSDQQSLQEMRREIDDLKAMLRAQALGVASPENINNNQNASARKHVSEVSGVAAEAATSAATSSLTAQGRISNVREAAVNVRSAAVRTTSNVRDRILKRLLRIGISNRISERLVQAIELDMEVDRAWKIALSRLSDAVPTVGENIADRGGILAFVGATGVGKTTTIGKLAAQYVLKHGSSSIALVTTDIYRIAAHEQLRTFGRILDIPVRTVDENRTLDETLHSLRDKRLVLVDTSGMSSSSGPREQQLEMLNSSAYRIKKFLVLPCTAQQRVLESSCHYFKPLGLNGAVLSKIDESLSLGEVISTIVESRLPVAYLGDGQKIPDNIEVARSNTIVSRAVVLAEEQARAERERSMGELEDSSLFDFADTVNNG
ncbi:hypothetical protein [Motiliproteus sp. MSK22-1]|uniref:hypothetical protein n=1 Tax=Motiliproteus sp. MSK22-1 TaxID=1897630 RepID=UPI0009765C4D|nr:hypothetical protein [Motiliproteus sp. MSK22-1]OMH30048.1 hypothetical protein BGP75_19145 [Motiliproteus sp. MSK22-1]